MNVKNLLFYFLNGFMIFVCLSDYFTRDTKAIVVVIYIATNILTEIADELKEEIRRKK